MQQIKPCALFRKAGHHNVHYQGYFFVQIFFYTTRKKSLTLCHVPLSINYNLTTTSHAVHKLFSIGLSLYHSQCIGQFCTD